MTLNMVNKVKENNKIKIKKHKKMNKKQRIIINKMKEDQKMMKIY